MGRICDIKYEWIGGDLCFIFWLNRKIKMNIFHRRALMLYILNMRINKSYVWSN